MTGDDRRGMETRRQAVIDALTERYARDELPMDEYERLVADIHRAEDPRELSVVEDIVGGNRETSIRNGLNQIGETMQSCIALLSERKHSGNWLKEKSVSGVTVLASQVFDFREVDLPEGATTIELFTLLGSAEIIVPGGIAVRMEAIPIAGEASVGRGIETRERPGQSTLVITGSAVLGSIVVKRR